jgi:predicted RNA-binding protein with RPS1 domain
LGEKQTQQHRQHFNLGESAKQMLEELTAKRYPGKQRRQSQLVVDLITEAFTKEHREHSMNTVTTGMQDPEPNGLEPATTEAISMAHNEAVRMGAIEVYPEHLLLGVIGQGESKAAKLLCMYGMDMQAIRVRATEVFSSHYRDSANAALVLSEESRECIERAISLAVDLRFPSVSPEHLVVSVLRYPPMQPFLIPFLPSVSTLMARLGEGMGPAYANYLHQWEGSTVREWRQRRREELLDELKPGEVRHGIVSNIANFGVFVDLGGAEGLVQINQVAWSPVNHPSEVLHVGQHVEVQVLSVDKEKKKIALSIKRVEVDPWTTVEQRYMPGQVVTGVITRIVPFGAFARIEDGVEGLIPLSELRPGMDPGQNLREGQLVQLRILHIDAERRRLGLSLRQVDEVDLKETLVEGITICSSCKREVQSKWKHCVYCGASLARVCPQCGSPQPEIEGARFCFECGSELE